MLLSSRASGWRGLAVLLLVGTSAFAADLSTQISRGALDTALVAAGDVSGSGTFWEPFGPVTCSLSGCKPRGYVQRAWSWRVLSARYLISQGAASMEIVFRATRGTTTLVQKVTTPVAAQVNFATNRVMLSPQSAPTAVSFPTVMGNTVAGTVDPALRFTLGVPLDSTVPLAGRALRAGVRNVTVSWGSDALNVLADARFQ